MLDINNIPIFNNDNQINSNEIFNTSIKIENIEKTLNEILDKHSDICKYFINYSEFYWSISFNVDIDQLEDMLKTSFEIKVYKGNYGNSILHISKEIYENRHWMELLNNLKKLKINL